MYMSSSSFVPTVPPLPPGWTEHTGPGGQLYYYNAQTQESTYVRPVPTFSVMPMMQAEPPRKKEKPAVKIPIPGTEWLRVRTTEGNVFYSHKFNKQSLWTVPDEIKEAVEKWDKEDFKQSQTKGIGGEALRAEHRERPNLSENKEEQGMAKRKAEDHSMNELLVAKKAKVEVDEDESDESEEEEWQKEAAVQLAVEAEEERVRQEEEAVRLKEAEAEARRARLIMPERVDLSIDEAKALFKTLLREKDINPLHPWDTSLPIFISDPRYALLPSVSARREAFDEYCRDRSRELRQSATKKVKEVTNPIYDFERLLQNEVKSTRTSWTEFRRAWKKDRMFYGWGRDDREREKKFREFIKELGEKKKAMAQKAEVNFFDLLRDKVGDQEGLVWKDVKRKLYNDPRYDAVGSSSLREELFNTFLKGKNTRVFQEPSASSTQVVEEDEDMEDKERLRKQKKERAIQDRQQKVQQERERLEVDIGKSRNDVSREQGERDYKTMLTDAIRDPQITWEVALPQLKTDPRFQNSPLQPNHQLHLFHEHVDHLRSKHIQYLYALFEDYAPSLAGRLEDLPMSSLISSPPVIKLGYDKTAIQQEFQKWQRERTQEARNAFGQMLGENAFVEFWGRLGKIGGEGVEGGVKADETEGEDGEGGGGKVDMKLLAKNVDVGDMEKVLKNDKRFIMFDHVPEQREQWLRDYLSNLSAPKLSVHLPQSA
ncbi:hypothetical protein H0H81_007408 [Sphagnurus paluster]|uniref:Transcription elongation regulator 1 n=1 Tax=Sphagnurus paluster TaxID=117069 RepID=A0A9P7K3D3_9AGAR|nr:hypothetical protein H0H81_007408 [Sphagnurus paluster]